MQLQLMYGQMIEERLKHKSLIAPTIDRWSDDLRKDDTYNQ